MMLFRVLLSLFLLMSVAGAFEPLFYIRQHYLKNRLIYETQMSKTRHLIMKKQEECPSQNNQKSKKSSGSADDKRKNSNPNHDEEVFKFPYFKDCDYNKK